MSCICPGEIVSSLSRPEVKFNISFFNSSTLDKSCKLRFNATRLLFTIRDLQFLEVPQVEPEKKCHDFKPSLEDEYKKCEPPDYHYLWPSRPAETQEYFCFA